MLMAVKHQIGMDLVADHNHTVVRADLGHSGQFFLCPGSSHGIVGVGDNHQLCPGVFCSALQIVKVDGVSAVFIHQAIIADFTVVVINGKSEGMIDRTRKDDAVPFLRKCLDHGVEHRHNTRGKDQPLGVHLPSVPLFHPIHRGGFEIVCHKGVPIDWMLCSFYNSIHHRLGATEIGIGHPHRQRIRIAYSRSNVVPLGRRGIAAVNDLIKIVNHTHSPQKIVLNTVFMQIH